MSPWRTASLWVPVGACMAALYLASSRSDVEPIRLGWDKLVHTGAYAVLALLALRASHGGMRRLAARPTLVAAAIALLYGLFDEVHQNFVPGRDASVLDWVADLVGVALAIGLAGILGTLRSGIEIPGSSGGAEG